MSLIIVDDDCDVPDEVKHQMEVLVALFSCPSVRHKGDEHVKEDISTFLSTNIGPEVPRVTQDNYDKRGKKLRKVKTSVGKHAVRRSKRIAAKLLVKK